MTRNVPVMVAIFTSSVFITFYPNFWIDQRIRDYQGFFAGLGLFSLSFWITSAWFAHKPTRAKIWHLKCIGLDERAVLLNYVIEDRSCCYFNPLDGPVLALISKGILFYAGRLVPITDAPIIIDPYVARYLKRKPNILGLVAKDIGSKSLSAKQELYDYINP